MSRARILPVIDLLGGVVVRGVGGRREEYRPVVSRLVPSAEPLAVARAFRQAFGFSELYVADLDAIEGREPAWDDLARLQAEGLRLWVDAGIAEPQRARQLHDVGIERTVIGLETLPNRETLRRIITAVGPERLVFSLDLRGGRPLAGADWGDATPEEIVADVVAAGLRAVLVLDLAGVGSAAGVPTEDLCRSLHQTHPDVELLAGGGVRDLDDVRRLGAAGVGRVLVASALHDGRIKPGELSGS